MRFSPASIFTALLLLPVMAAAQPVPAQGGAAQPPKLVPALGWDVAKQGGFATSVTVDAQNSVWVGTEGNGLWRYDSRKKEWTQFTSKDGLGDDSIYALAVDKLGRVWAGHLNHGVSVWNGAKWKNYGIVDGPLGCRVFAIATCPTDGDVWIATDRGVTRYSIADDDWDYFNRASGLPSSQIQAIAFDSKGNIYLGTQCDGIAMADAKNKYAKWIAAPALQDVPNSSTGVGIASNLINDLTVVPSPPNVPPQAWPEMIFAATPLGLSASGDDGDHFAFNRGEDWQDNMKGLLNAPAAANPQAANGNLAFAVRAMPMNPFAGGMGVPQMRALAIMRRSIPMEDWVTCVHAEKESGRLWVGYRTKGLEVRGALGAGSVRYDTGNVDTDVRSIWTGAKAPAYIAVYDPKNGGLKTPGDSVADLDPGDAPKELPALPSPAKPPGADDLAPIIKRLDVYRNQIKPGEAVFFGDDWNTGGDWVLHYGNSYAMLYFNEDDTGSDDPEGPVTVPYASEPGFKSSVDIGPHKKTSDEHKVNAGDTDASYHSANRATKDPRVLYSPRLGRRSEGEVNDGSFDKDKYPPSWEGPDLWVNVEVPGGEHYVSLYFQNYDAQEAPGNNLRDYEIQFLHPEETKELTLKGAPLAHARVADFKGGVYKSFLVMGPAKYVVRIKRNRSSGTKLQGLFIDRVAVDAATARKPLPGFDATQYAQAPADHSAPADNPALAAANTLWDKLVDNLDKSGVAANGQPFFLWAYRAAAAARASDSHQANWRWQMGVWDEDRDAFDKAMATAYKAWSEKSRGRQHQTRMQE